MDHKEKPRARSDFANEATNSESDARIAGGPMGHENNQGADPASVSALDIDKSKGGQPRSLVTGRHEPGMGANETVDGLAGTAEAVRRAAEDTPPDAERDEPVFDAAQAPAKV